MTLSVKNKSVLNEVPVGMQNSSLVLKDEDGDSIVTDLEELAGASQLNLAPAAINIENSSDVIIGPVTQFNGPVTIYQNVNGTVSALQSEDNKSSRPNGKLVKSESTCSDITPHTAEKTTKTLYPKHLKYILLCLFILTITVVTVTTTIIALKSQHEKPKPDRPRENLDGEDNDDVLVPVGSGQIIEKKIWGGRAALNGTIVLKHPTPYVIISHTVTPKCLDFDSCSSRIKSIQDYHMAKLGSPDVGYNFLIGGDGNAYVGRGWDIKNFHSSDSIGISFVGDYIVDYLTPDMISITQKLLEDGVKTGKLSKDYKLVGHNQTYATESPGPHVYEVIKKWPHFFPKRLLLN